jgi:hypothetical protein
MVVHTCSPNTWAAEAGALFQASLSYRARVCLKKREGILLYEYPAFLLVEMWGLVNFLLGLISNYYLSDLHLPSS